MYISDISKNKKAYYLDILSEEVENELLLTLSILKKYEIEYIEDEEEILMNFFLDMLLKNLFEITFKSMLIYINEIDEDTLKNISLKEYLKKKETKLEFFNHYKILYSDCITIIKNWSLNTIITYRNIFGNLKSILTFFGYKSTAKIVKINSSFGDFHNNNKCVIKITFDNGKSIFYKPRTGEQEIIYKQLLYKIEEFINFEFKKLKIFSNEDHHFVEEVVYKECENQEEVEKYYLKIGVHLFLLYIMNSNDIHFENLICCGEDPVLVDLETIINPIRIFDLFPFKNDVNRYITELIQKSVVQSQLLGINTILNDKKVNIGGISNVDEIYQNSFEIDERKIHKPSVRYKSNKIDGLNLPKIKNKVHLPSNYQDEIIKGFSVIYNVFYRNEKNIQNFLLSKLKKLKVRVLLRDTEEYGRIVTDLVYPSNIWEKDNRFNLLKTLRKDIIYNKFLKDVYGDECIQLLNFDIPYFYTYADSKDLHSTNKMYKNFLTKTCISIVKDKFKDLDKNDLKFQIKIIKELTNDIKVFNNNTLTNKDIEHFDYQYEISKKLEKVINSSIVSNKNIGWFSTFEEEGKMIQISPITASIYSGIGGILILLLEYSKISNKFNDTFQKILNTYIEDLYPNDLTVNFFKPNSGIFNGGVTEYIFILSKIKDLSIIDTNWCLYKMEYLLLIYDEKIDIQEDLSILNGVCGDLMCFINIRKIDSLTKRADSLILKLYKKVKSKIHFLIKNNKMKIGYAHGASGIAYTLSNLIDLNLIENTEILDLISILINYENKFFNSSNGNWKESSDMVYLEGWCNGTPGILFSRALIFDKIKCKVCKENVKSGLEYFINNCLNNNDSLCHGDSGNILILKKLNELKLLDDSKYIELLNNFSYGISNRKFNPGYKYSFLPVELFTGKSGLIYSLLNIYTNNSESILEFK
jgi:type 2 lantibiotic biosynthesis protein LanM